MILTVKPEPKQHLAYQALDNPEVDEILFGGAAGGGKSWWLCESRLIRALRFPGYKSFIGRKELKRLMNSTYLTWIKVCKWHDLKQDLDWKLDGKYNFIEFKNGSRIDLLDLAFAPQDPFYERFGSLEYTDGAIEEGGEVEFLAYDTLKGRINRHMNREYGIHANLAITANPKKNWLYTEFYYPWKKGVLPKNKVFIQSFYRDNSHTALDYGKTLASIRDVANRKRLKDGDWEYDSDANTMIDYNAILDMFTNTIEPIDEKYLIVDAARQGGDKIVYNCWKGFHSYKITYRTKQGTDQTEEDIREIAREEKIPYSHILVDEDGIGGGIVDHLKGVKGFVANRRPFDVWDESQSKMIPSNFQNLKAQCSYKLADMVNDHLISVTTDDVLVKEEIAQDLQQIKSKDKDSDGKLKIVPKEEVKENLQGRSPDIGDTFMMRMFFVVKKAEVEKTTEKEYDSGADQYLKMLERQNGVGNEEFSLSDLDQAIYG